MMRPLTLKELEEKVSEAVYVENLTEETCPRQTYPAAVFAW